MRKQCRRKIYALVNPIAHAIEGCQVTPERELNSLRVRELQAIQAFTDGHATLTHWQDIADMLNIAEAMARGGVGLEVLEVCEAAQSALMSAAKRFEKWRKMELTPSQLQAVRELYGYHDLQRQSISRSEYEGFIKTTTNRIKSSAPEVVRL